MTVTHVLVEQATMIRIYPAAGDILPSSRFCQGPRHVGDRLGQRFCHQCVPKPARRLCHRHIQAVSFLVGVGELKGSLATNYVVALCRRNK